MSSVTYMELMVGAFNKQEANMIRKAFSDIDIIEISDFRFIGGLNLI